MKCSGSFSTSLVHVLLTYVSLGAAPRLYQTSVDPWRLCFCCRRRLVYKNGECNVTNKHIRKYKRHYLADIFTTLIDLKWRYSLAIFTGSFVLSWVLFAVVWFIIGYAHKDFDPPSPNHDPCVVGVTDFTTAFLDRKSVV